MCMRARVILFQGHRSSSQYDQDVRVYVNNVFFKSDSIFSYLYTESGKRSLGLSYRVRFQTGHK